MSENQRQIFNPFLPLDTYIPDVEPHVFEDRVYLYGSQDKENGDTFCLLDYVIWSAPVNDLSSWSNKGINYKAEQDPSFSSERCHMYAPDCVKGNDEKYYLYYSLSGYKGVGGYHGPMSVAVSDTPDGKFEFHGFVKNKDGSLMKRFVPFDPGLINDDGVIRLYYGTWYPFNEMPFLLRLKMRKVQAKMFNKTVDEIKVEPNGVLGAVSCTLEDDMLTVKEDAKHILNPKTKGTPFESKMYFIKKDGHNFYGHGFFEASSIRKINDTYYFIYSSFNGNELCYATSSYPDKDFTYRGVIISNGDEGYLGRKGKDRVNHTATNHGSIENINGQWYVFYHRQTHGTDYSRQVCAEPIEIQKDGTIKQVEVTSSGLNIKPLKGEGIYPAVICCNLTNGKMPHGGNTKFKGLPMITSKDNERFITNLSKDVVVRYKYFDFTKTKTITLRIRGNGVVSIHDSDKFVAGITVDSTNWKEYQVPFISSNEKSILQFKVETGNLDIISFTLN